MHSRRDRTPAIRRVSTGISRYRHFSVIITEPHLRRLHKNCLLVDILVEYFCGLVLPVPSYRNFVHRRTPDGLFIRLSPALFLWTFHRAVSSLCRDFLFTYVIRDFALLVGLPELFVSRNSLRAPGTPCAGSACCAVLNKQLGTRGAFVSTTVTFFCVEQVEDYGEQITGAFLALARNRRLMPLRFIAPCATLVLNNEPRVFCRQALNRWINSRTPWQLAPRYLERR